MSNNKMLIDASHPEETRVAMVRGNQVDEFDFESEHKHQIRGNIYLAKVTRVEPSLQAAFVDYGGNRHGFLAFSEIHPDYYQIPIADRQALLEAEAEDARAAARDEDVAGDRAGGRSNGGGGSSARASDDDGDDGESGGEKPARKRRSRRSRGRNSGDDVAADDTVETVAETTDEESDDSDEEMNADDEGGDAVSEPARKPRRRTSRKKAEPEVGDAVAAVETASEVATSADDEKPKPKRRASRKKAEPVAENVADATSGEAPKPVRRRTSRKKAEPEATETESEAPAAEEKPKRRRTSRAKKTAIDEVVEAIGETVDKAAEAVSDAGEAVGDAVTETLAEVEADASEAPPRKTARRSRGRGRSRNAEAKSADDATSEDDVPDTPEPAVASEGDDPVEEVRPPRRTQRRSYKIQEVIKRRQILLVQVTKEERGNKGAALTTYLSLAGRYSVLMPNTARGGGISRKIVATGDRKRLKQIAGQLDVPQGMGVILRTAGASRTPAEIQRDFEYLMRLWENVRTLTLESSAPYLVYEEGSLIKRSIRDLYDKDTSEILVAGEAGYREAKDFMKMLMPSHARNVKLYKDKVPIFARMGVEAQLDAMLQPQVTLKSGGYLIINQTEALVAIDVNSGRSTRQHSVEDTAVQTNLEAADEVARQLRLRDLAGLIVIDFIDMDRNGNVRKVENRLKDALKSDKARIQVGRISHFGLMEMSRQRMRSSVLESTTQVCPTCEGLGHVRASSSVGLQVIRAIEEQLNKGATHDMVVKVTAATALYLLNSKRASISDLEDRFGVNIAVEIDETIGNVPCVVEKGEVSNRQPVQRAVQVDSFDDDDEAEPEDDEATADALSEESQAAPEPQQTNAREDKGADPDGDPDGGGRKKRRRRRRKRGGGADSEADANTEEASEAANEDGTPAERPARSRRRRRGSTEDAAPEQAEAVTVIGDLAEASAQAPAAEPEQAAASEPAGQSANEPAPRKRVSRPAPGLGPKTEPAANGASADAQPAEETPRKPRRSTRRAETKDDAQADDASEPAASAEPEPDDDSPRKAGWWRRKLLG